MQSPPPQRQPSTSRRRPAGTPYHPTFAMPEPEPDPQPPPHAPSHAPSQADAPDQQRGPAHPGAGDERARRPIRNPLPALPRNVYESSPYDTLISLPQTTALLSATYGPGPLGDAPRKTDSLGRKKSRKGGLFRSLSARRRESSPPPHALTAVSFVPVLGPQNGAPPPTAAGPAAMPVPAPAAPGVPPVTFSHQSDELAGFMNHSAHRVLHQNKTYPSALHLHEAFKFMDHRPELAERIRHCARVQEVYPLSASLQDQVRPDWGQVFLGKVCLYSFPCFEWS